ncbi:MAG: hypothetical protein FWG84_05345, partial [Bacteroidales bacterium]|nr:hypothetical protein [Bacteroidales bacterium]
MKKIIYIITYMMLASPFWGWGQGKSSCSVLELSDPQTSGSHSARDMVKMTNGFSSDPYFRAFIDETKICDITYQDPVDPDRPLDYNKPVGAIAGVVDVSPTGAATYQIPVFTPPGTAGMEPQISIVYNSQGGNGTLGVGWDIAGLSAITRAPKTIYHDGIASAVTLNHEMVGNTIQMRDRLALDGERMIMMPNTGEYYSDPDAIYTTEGEKFLRITPKDYTLWEYPMYPTWFEVRDKNGRTLEYGKEGNSLMAPMELADNAYAWKLNKVTDANGNYMNYIYTKGEGVSWIDKIEYTGNSITGMPTYNTITFLYATRSDPQILYIGGYMKNTVLLRGIKVESNGEVVRRYWFNYNKDFYSHLVEIVEEGSDGESLNSTIVQWGLGTHELTKDSIYLYINPRTSNIVATADFNCDGKEDIVVVNYIDKKWMVYVSSDSGFVKKYESESYGENAPEWIMAYVSPPNLSNVPYIFLEERWGGGNCNPGKDERCITHKIFRYELDTHDNNHVERDTYLASVFQAWNWYYVFADSKDNKVGDYGKLKNPSIFQAFDCKGDGNIKFIAKSPQYNKLCTNLASHNIGEHINASTAFVLADFTGAGKQDLLTMKLVDNGTKINVRLYVFNRANNNDSCFQVSNDTYWGQKIMLGDFNGDGKADLLISDDKEKKYYVAFSKGDEGGSNTAFTDAFELEEFNGKTNYFHNIGDVNGDGKDDLLYEYLNGVCIAYAKGDNSFDYQDFEYPDGMHDFAGYNGHLIDYYGTGKKVFCYVKHYDNSTINLISLQSENAGERQHFVKRIRNGLGENISFEYLPLTKGGEFHKRLFSTDDPVTPIQPPLYAVSKLIQDDGIGGHSINEYSYQEARMHRLGRGFLGFSNIIVKNSIFDRMTQYEYICQRIFCTVYLRTQTAFILSSGEKISEIYTQQLIKNLGDKRYFPYIDMAWTKDFAKETEVRTTIQYDDDGNVTQQEKKYLEKHGVYTPAIFTETNKYKYEQYGNWGVKNCLVNDTTITKHEDDANSYTRVTSYEYDNKANLNKIISDVGVTTSYLINSYGLADKKTVSASGEASYIEDFVYDGKKRFVETTTVTGLGSSTNKYSNTGTLLSETDITGLKTSYKYDGFGRMTGTKTPEGHIINTNYGWKIDDSIKSVSFMEVTAPGRPTAKTYYDILGREVRSEIEGYDGRKILTDQKYNAKGQLWQTSFPYFANEATNKKWTVNGYDLYGRIETVTTKLATDLITKYDYNDSERKITVTMPDNTKSSKIYNVHDEVVSETDKGGTITYKYHSSGQPREISTGDAIFKMTYDTYGQQETLVDPNAGTIVYTYNAFGQMKTQKDARNKLITNYYDDFRRLQTQTTTGEPDKTWIYNTSGNGKGQIKSITSSQSEQSYDYGAFGRLTKVTEKVAGDQSFVTQYEYDEYGNQTKITYPGGFSVKREYNNAGYLTTIKRGDNDDLIWQRQTQNAMGQPLTYKMGNNKTTTCQYDGYYLPERIYTSGIQDFSYSFNPENGNLEWRKDNQQNLQENFSYDDLNRLDSIRQGNATTLTLTYNNNGNITTKSDAATSTYAYHGTKKHAVTTINNPLATLAQSGNQKISYTSFHKADTIKNLDTNQRLVIRYSVDNQRIRSQYYENNQLQKTKYFAANYEKEITPAKTREISYISTPYGVLAAYIKENGAGQMYYLYKDHLGSITTIINQSGTDVERRSFDAWGRLRHPDNWNYVNIP